MSVRDYLKRQEWSMGNGQCPECCGVPASWHGHPCHMTADTIGHELDCPLADAMAELGMRPLYVGEYKSADQFETYISDSGIIGTRPKTAEGCSRVAEFNRRFDDEVWSALPRPKQ